MQLFALVREEPLLLRLLGVAHEQHANLTVANEQDHAREVGIHERRGHAESGARNSSATPSTAIVTGVCRTAAWSRFAASSDAHTTRPPREAGVDVGGGVKRVEDGRRTADVIRVRVRQHEQSSGPPRRPMYGTTV